MWDYGEGNRGAELAIVSIAMAAISVIAVALRSYTMATLLKRFLIEDWLAVLTCLLQCGFCAIVVIGASYGLGAHVENVSEENRHKALIFKWAGQVAYIAVSTLVKFVVGIFLLRLCVNNTWQRHTIIVLLVVVGVFNAFYIFVAIFQCQPIPYYWYRYTPDPPVTGKCNGKVLATVPTYFAVLIGIAADLTLALLPATLIKGAHLDKRTKISVCCVLALGSFASVATIARIPYAKQLLSNPDYLYNFTDLAIWSIVECGIAITASSLATLRPLFVKMKLLATGHFTSRFGQSSGVNSTGLPMQSARTVTIISSRARDTKRNTAMTGATAFSGSTAVTGSTGALTSVKEGGGDVGIQVEKEFEMSIITRETSQDSIDRLEAEINEVIRPGTAKRKASYDRLNISSRSSSLSARPRPTPLQTSFPSSGLASPAVPTSISGGSSPSSGARFVPQTNANPPSPLSGQNRRPSNGWIPRKNSFGQSPTTPVSPYSGIGSAFTDTIIRSPPPIPEQPSPPSRGHQHTYSDHSVTRQSPGFHLPTRMQNHQSVVSQSHQSVMSTTTSHYSRGTFGGGGRETGLRMTDTDMNEYIPNHQNNNYNNNNNNNSNDDSSSLGSPISMTGRQDQFTSRSAVSPTAGSPISNVRFPFQRQTPASGQSAAAAATTTTTTPAASKSKRGKQRVSAFLADDSSISSAEDHEDEMPLRKESAPPAWTQRAQDAPSPLRSHPPTLPKGNWL